MTILRSSTVVGRPCPSSWTAMADNGRGDPAVNLGYPGGEHRMSVTGAALGTPGIGLGTLRAATGMVTLDSGFVNTAGCRQSENPWFWDADRLHRTLRRADTGAPSSRG
jgi:hypothetical protein